MHTTYYHTVHSGKYLACQWFHMFALTDVPPWGGYLALQQTAEQKIGRDKRELTTTEYVAVIYFLYLKWSTIISTKLI